MARGRGKKKSKTKGSLNTQDINKRIEKQSANQKKQEPLKINANSTFGRPIASIYASGPVHPIIPTSASAHASIAYNNWAAIKGERKAFRDQICGYIFMCNGKTKPECFSYRVFGLPAARMEVVEKIKPNTKLFLFDFDLKLLYGVYIAASNGQFGLEPTAFGGKFPAQVRYEIMTDCLPLPESAFKHVIKDNYEGVKFKQELSDKQVNNLISLFRPIAVPPSAPVVAPLLPNAIRPLKMLPSRIEERVQPPPDDRHVAGLHLTSARMAPVYHHVRQSVPPPYEPYGASAHIARVQPGVQSQHLLPVGTQPYCEMYYPAEAHQPYVPQNPALPLQHPYSRYTTVPVNIGSETLPQSGPAKDYYNENKGPEATYAPVQAHSAKDYYNENKGPAATYPPVQAHSPVVSQTPASSHEPAYLTSSSLVAAYWAEVASRVPNQVYSDPYQGLPLGSTGLAGEKVSDRYQRLPLGSTGLAGEKVSDWYQRLPLVGTGPGGENVCVSLAGANAPAQAHTPMPSQFPTHSYEAAHLPSSSLPSVYWAAAASEVPNHVYSSPHQRPPAESTSLGGESVSVVPAGANAPVEGHALLPSQFVVPSHEPAHLSSTSLPAAYWAAVASEDPNQVYSGPYQRLPSGSTDLGGGNAAASLAGAPPTCN